jgi:hypothetical protein
VDASLGNNANSVVIEKKWMNGCFAATTFEGEYSNVTSSYAGKGVVRNTWRSDEGTRSAVGTNAKCRSRRAISEIGKTSTRDEYFAF